MYLNVSSVVAQAMGQAASRARMSSVFVIAQVLNFFAPLAYFNDAIPALFARLPRVQVIAATIAKVAPMEVNPNASRTVTFGARYALARLRV